MIFRKPEFGDKVFLIALENDDLLQTYTLMALNGELVSLILLELMNH